MSPELSEKFPLAPCSLKTCLVCSQPLNRELVAYAAGILDGEGCLIVVPCRIKGRISYYPRMTVRMKNPHALNVLYRLFGGTINAQACQKPQWAATLSWSLGGMAVACPLRLMFSYLHTKRPQAEIILSLLNHPWLRTANNHGIQWSPETIQAWEKAKRRIGKLNKLGTAMGEDPPFAVLVGDRWMSPQRDLLGERWVEYSETWPTSGMLRDGMCFQRETWGPAISDDECSSWQTPAQFQGKYRRQVGQTIRAEELLPAQAENWPTPGVLSPNALRGSGQNPAKRREGGHQVNLQDAVTVWPTPSAHGSAGETSEELERHGQKLRNRQTGRILQTNLATEAKMIFPFGPPAPPTSTPGPASSPSAPTSPRRLRLNPAFVTWLQGLPEGWCSLAPINSKCWAIWSSRCRRQLRLFCSPDERE